MLNLLKNTFAELKKFQGETFVIVCDGEVLEDQDLLKSFAEDIVNLSTVGIKPIIIHDGGDIINDIISKFSLNPSLNNLTKNDPIPIELMEMILSGHVNKSIVTKINSSGGNAVGISGKDSSLMTARRAKIANYESDSNNKILNFGFAGELAFMQPDILLMFEDNELIPVIAPIALGDDNRTYKINAYEVAGAIAAVLSATKIIFLSNLEGIKDFKGNIIKETTLAKLTKSFNFSKEQEIQNKLNAIQMCFEQNTASAYILNGKIEHAILVSLFTEDTAGTCINI